MSSEAATSDSGAMSDLKGSVAITIPLELRMILRCRGVVVKEWARGCGAGRQGGAGEGRDSVERRGYVIAAGAGGAGPGGSAGP